MKWLASVLLALGLTASVAPMRLNEQNHRLVSSAGPQPGIGNGQLNIDSSEGAEALALSRQYTPQQPVLLASHPTASSPLRGFCHPIRGPGFITQGNNGLTHRGRSAYAYDLAVSMGTPIYAMRSGKVVAFRDRYPDTGGGRSKFSKFNFIMIQHDNGYRSAYMHLKQNFNSVVRLKEQDFVKAGQLIGYSGNSGWSTGPHLHVEVQRKSSTKRFVSTVPFQMAGLCQTETVATNN